MISKEFVLRLLSRPDGSCTSFASLETAAELFSGRDEATASSSCDKIAAADVDLFSADLDLDFEVLGALEALIVVLTRGCNQQGQKPYSHATTFITE